MKTVLPQFQDFSDVADRFDDIADLIETMPGHDPVPFLRASARRYRALLAGTAPECLAGLPQGVPRHVHVPPPNPSRAEADAMAKLKQLRS